MSTELFCCLNCIEFNTSQKCFSKDLCYHINSDSTTGKDKAPFMCMPPLSFFGKHYKPNFKRPMVPMANIQGLC